MGEFLLKAFLSAMLMLLIKGGVAMAGHWIAWWMAALIALAVVFGGWLVIVDSDADWWH